MCNRNLQLSYVCHVLDRVINNDAQMIVNLEKLSDCLGVGYGIKDADLADVQTVQSKVKRPH